jgi:integrase
VYKHQKKIVTDSYGWEGMDFHNEDDVVATAVELRQNRKKKTPPFTLNELLSERQKELDDAAELLRKEQERLEREELIKLDSVFEKYCIDNAHKVSLRDEKSYYKNWIKKPIGQKRLDQITLLDLERIRKKMQDAGKAPRSIGYIKTITRQIYNYAAERNLYTGPLPTVHFLKKQRVDNKRQRYLSPEEADTLLQKIREASEQTYRICLLSLNSGMRFGEIASLQWQHITTDRREILVIDPKNAESRSVYMTDTTRMMFDEMKQGKPADLVFPSRKGGKMSSISKTFARSVAELQMNEEITDRRLQVVFHTLRHSCASWLVNSGVELPVIARILGHKSLQMTMRYSHVNDTSVQGAMKMLDQHQEKPEKIVIPINKNG